MGEFLYSADDKSHTEPSETKQEDNFVFILVLDRRSQGGLKPIFVL